MQAQKIYDVVIIGSGVDGRKFISCVNSTGFFAFC